MLAGRQVERDLMFCCLFGSVFTHAPVSTIPVAVLHTRSLSIEVLPLVNAWAHGVLSALKPMGHCNLLIFLASSHFSPNKVTDLIHFRALERLTSLGTWGTFHSFSAWRMSWIFVICFS